MTVTETFHPEFDSDIWDLAALLLDKHSELAAKIVFEMAIDSLNADDYERSAMWALVGSAIDELRKSQRPATN